MCGVENHYLSLGFSGMLRVVLQPVLLYLLPGQCFPVLYKHVLKFQRQLTRRVHLRARSVIFQTI